MDLFDWITRVLPGPVVTFGLDLFIDGMILVGLNVADTAQDGGNWPSLNCSSSVSVFAVGAALGPSFAPSLEWDLRKAGDGIGAASAG